MSSALARSSCVFEAWPANTSFCALPSSPALPAVLKAPSRVSATTSPRLSAKTYAALALQYFHAAHAAVTCSTLILGGPIHEGVDEAEAKGLGGVSGDDGAEESAGVVVGHLGIEVVPEFARCRGAPDDVVLAAPVANKANLRTKGASVSSARLPPSGSSFERLTHTKRNRFAKPLHTSVVVNFARSSSAEMCPTIDTCAPLTTEVLVRSRTRAARRPLSHAPRTMGDRFDPLSPRR